MHALILGLIEQRLDELIVLKAAQTSHVLCHSRNHSGNSGHCLKDRGVMRVLLTIEDTGDLAQDPNKSACYYSKIMLERSAREQKSAAYPFDRRNFLRSVAGKNPWWRQCPGPLRLHAGCCGTAWNGGGTRRMAHRRKRGDRTPCSAPGQMKS